MRKYKILLVDDDPLVLMTVGRNLEIEGYQVSTAENGKNALELLEKTFFDLVITDLEMAPITGVEILRKTKTLYPGTKVIIFSGCNDLGSLSDADGYLIKPCELEEINLRIFQCLESDDFLNPDDNHQTQIKKFQGNIIIIKAFEFAKQMIDFQKTAFTHAFNAMILLQEQTERITDTLLGQTPKFPEG
jgi:DNA-binding NtrC family response regulator